MVTGAVAEYVNHGDTRWLDAISAQIAVLWHESVLDSRGQKKLSRLALSGKPPTVGRRFVERDKRRTVLLIQLYTMFAELAS